MAVSFKTCMQGGVGSWLPVINIVLLLLLLLCTYTSECTFPILCTTHLGKSDLRLHLLSRQHTDTYMCTTYLGLRRLLSLYLPACGVPCPSTKCVLLWPLHKFMTLAVGSQYLHRRAGQMGGNLRRSFGPDLAGPPGCPSESKADLDLDFVEKSIEAISIHRYTVAVGYDVHGVAGMALEV